MLILMLKHIFQVIVNYPSRKVTTVCEPEDGQIINHINKKNWKGAAKRIVAHKELLEHLKPCILQLIHTLLCSPKEGFMLWRSSPGDLACFSFSALEADLHRLSPFLLSVFNTITNHSRLTTCAAAAIAIRGRQSQLSAFAYYLNSILSYGGANKAVFNRLSKMSITTSHKCAIGKQKELANTCANRLLQLKQQKEHFLHIGKVAGITDRFSYQPDFSLPVSPCFPSPGLHGCKGRMETSCYGFVTHLVLMYTMYICVCVFLGKQPRKGPCFLGLTGAQGRQGHWTRC